MYEFFDRSVNAALPRVRDFKGVSDRSFDGRGNYALGLREQIIFPEIDLDKVDKVRGMTVCINTTAKTDAEGRALLRPWACRFGSRSRLWRKRVYGSRRNAPRSFRFGGTIGARCAAGRARSIAASKCVGSACATWRAKGEIPGLTKASW